MEIDNVHKRNAAWSKDISLIISWGTQNARERNWPQSKWGRMTRPRCSGDNWSRWRIAHNGRSYDFLWIDASAMRLQTLGGKICRILPCYTVVSNPSIRKILVSVSRRSNSPKAPSYKKKKKKRKKKKRKSRPEFLYLSKSVYCV